MALQHGAIRFYHTDTLTLLNLVHLPSSTPSQMDCKLSTECCQATCYLDFTLQTGEGIFDKLKGSMDKARMVGSRVVPHLSQNGSRRAEVS